MSKLIRAYCRVSTDLQHDGGVSLEVQEMRISALCVAQGHTLLKVYKDVASGKNTDRPQLQTLLAEIQSGETIAMLDLSRLSRSVKDTLLMVDDFDKRGIGIVSVTENIDTTSPQGRFMMHIISALNQLERENTAKKVKETMQVLSREGKLRGRPPFGWKFVGKDRDFEPEPEQQRILEKIKRLHIEGVSMTKIADTLNNDGDDRYIANNKKSPEKCQNSKFHQTTIKRILAEHGIIDAGNLKTKSIAEKIVSHHRAAMENPASFMNPPKRLQLQLIGHDKVTPISPVSTKIPPVIPPVIPPSNIFPSPPQFNTPVVPSPSPINVPVPPVLPHILPPPQFNKLLSPPIQTRNLPPPPDPAKFILK